jgi:hypothetical protein
LSDGVKSRPKPRENPAPQRGEAWLARPLIGTRLGAGRPAARPVLNWRRLPPGACDYASHWSQTVSGVSVFLVTAQSIRLTWPLASTAS